MVYLYYVMAQRPEGLVVGDAYDLAPAALLSGHALRNS